MKRSKFALSLFTVPLALLLGGPAQSALVTFDYTGTFASQSGFGVAIDFTGATIAGSFTFESTTADNAGTFQDAVKALSGSVSGTPAQTFGFSSTAGEIKVRDDYPVGIDSYQDRFQVLGGGLDDDLAGYTLIQFMLEENATGNPPPSYLTTGDLPLTPPAPFGSSTIELRFAPSEAAKVLTFTLTSLTAPSAEQNEAIAAVPEPATLALLGLGLAGLGLARRRR